MKNRTSINRLTAIKIMACNLVLSVVFSSCGGEIDSTKGTKIELIEPYKNELCKYTTNGSYEGSGNIFVHPLMFIDTCGKYKIGDVVCVGRKNY